MPSAVSASADRGCRACRHGDDVQRHTEVVRPDRHPELPREIVEMIAENGAAIPERRTDLLPRAGLAE